MLGAGAAFSTVLTAYRFTNGLRGIAPSETDEEEVERRENAKKYRRRPLSETIEQMGEGRGWSCSEHIAGHHADLTRNLRPWLRREAATTAAGEVRHRCEGCAGGGLEVKGLLTLMEEIASRRATRRTCTYINQCLSVQLSLTSKLPPDQHRYLIWTIITQDKVSRGGKGSEW